LRRARRSRKKKRLKWSRRSSARVAFEREEDWEVDASRADDDVGAEGRDREAASSERRNVRRRRKEVHSSRSKRELILRTRSFSPGFKVISSPFCWE
jgi:hypothetical protein